GGGAPEHVAVAEEDGALRVIRGDDQRPGAAGAAHEVDELGGGHLGEVAGEGGPARMVAEKISQHDFLPERDPELGSGGEHAPLVAGGVGDGAVDVVLLQDQAVEGIGDEFDPAGIGHPVPRTGWTPESTTCCTMRLASMSRV